MKTPLAATLPFLVLAAMPAASFAWGHAGHVGISRLAAQSLPDELPAFLRDALAAERIGELGAEADTSRSTGPLTAASGGGLRSAVNAHDAERDPGHYINIDDAGIVTGGVVALKALPATREAYDTAQRGAGQTQYRAGWLPYAMLDGFQQVRKDFAMWRALTVGLRDARSEGDRAWFRFQLQLRQEIAVRDIGWWSHFVADASQPLHVTIHYNGWGNYPNPKGYATAAIHAPFEGAFVRRFVGFAEVKALMRPYTDRGTTTHEQRVPAYLAETLSQVEPVYQAAKDSGEDNYATDKPAEHAVVVKALAAGASELRDQIVDAWRQSADIAVGYPLVKVGDIEAGKAAVTPGTFGSD